MNRFYDVEVPEGWTHVESMNVAGMNQDHYEFPLGHSIVSKDWPTRGWHASIYPWDPQGPAEPVERELQRFYECVGVPCRLLGRSRLTGTYQSHEDIFRGAGR